jgi:hypothetical protein
VPITREELRRELLRLLKEDEEFRYAVAGLLGLEEVLKRLDENTKAIRRLQEQVAENTKTIRSLQEQVIEHSKAIRSLQEEIIKHSKLIERLISAVQAIGMRYGVFTEKAFREGLKYLIEDLLKVYKVERWEYYDNEGIVYGHPSVIEVDVLIRDKERVLVEYKSLADKSDVAELYRIGILYERVTGVKPRLLMVAAGIKRRALELARQLGVEIRGEVMG